MSLAFARTSPIAPFIIELSIDPEALTIRQSLSDMRAAAAATARGVMLSPMRACGAGACCGAP